MIVYQYFEQVLEDIIHGVGKCERIIQGIRYLEFIDFERRIDFREDIAHRNHDDDKVWQVVIRRMEILSLIFYVGVLFVTIYLFFYHDWYCAIGINPCGRQNRKCPWLEKLAEDPACQHNSYN